MPMGKRILAFCKWRKTLIFFLCMFISTLLIQGTSEAALSLQDCRLGKVGLGDPYNMDVLNQEFGDLAEPIVGIKYDKTDKIRGWQFIFKDAFVFVENNQIETVRVTSPKLRNGKTPRTPKGLAVGDPVDKLIKLYGLPDHASGPKDSVYFSRNYYTYKGDEYIEMGVVVDPKTDKIVDITFGRYSFMKYLHKNKAAKQETK